MANSALLGRIVLGELELGQLFDSSQDRTITGVARIQNTTARPVNGVSRIQVTTDQTVTGVARITVSTDVAFTGVANIQNTTDQTVTGVANIRNTTTRTASGVGRITVTTSKTVTGKSRLQPRAAFTSELGLIPLGQFELGQLSQYTPNIIRRNITAVANIFGTTTRTQSGVARITATDTKTITGVSRIQTTVPKTIGAVARIETPGRWTLTGVARITATTQRTIGAVANIKVPAPVTGSFSSELGLIHLGQFELGQIDITPHTVRRIHGVANIYNSTARIQHGVANIRNTTARTQSCVANIIGSNRVTTSDTLALGITDYAVSIVEDTYGTVTDSDTLAIGITDASSITATTDVITTTSDTLALGITDSVVGSPTRHGLKADTLQVAISDSSAIAISGTDPATDLPILNPPEIKLSGLRAHGVFTNYGSEANDAIDKIKDVLVSAGWSEGTDVTATMVYSIPEGPPIATRPTPTARLGIFDDFCAFQGLLYWFYDPAIDTIIDYPNVIWVVKGTTASDSLGNLATALTINSTFNATVLGDNSGLALEAKFGGTSSNNQTINGLTHASITATSTFGGYLLTSSATRPDGNPQSQMTFRVTLSDYGSIGIVVKCAGNYISGTEITNDARVPYVYHLGKYSWNIWACPYQALLSPLTDSDAPFHAGDLYVYNSALFVCSPFIVAQAEVSTCAFGLYGVSSGAVVSGYQAVRQTLQTFWSSNVLDSDVYRNVSGNALMGYAMLMYQQSGMTLWNDSDPVVYMDAIVMLSRGQENYKAVGHIWDAYQTTQGVSDAPRGRAGFINYKGSILNTVVWATSGGNTGTMYLVVS